MGKSRKKNIYIYIVGAGGSEICLLEAVEGGENQILFCTYT